MSMLSRFAALGGGAVSNTDPYFSNVSLLLHMNGSNGGTTFTDNSPNAFSVTTVGNAQISTAQSKFGGSSGLFDGSGDYVYVDDNGSLDFGTGDFTVEAWVRPAGFTADANSILGGLGRTNGDWAFAMTGSTTLRWGRNWVAWDLTVSGITFVANTWYHVAVSRAGTSLKMFVNGVTRATATNSTSYGISNSRLAVGARQLTYGALSAGNYFNGYIDDVRVTNGVARYTADFTPPTAQFPDS